MTYDPQQHQRRSVRLPHYDYAQAGAYFVTIACRDRELLLEDSAFHEMVESTWLWLADQYDFVALDEYAVMPNHIHGIILIADVVGAVREPPLRAPKPLGRLVGAFKTVSTKRINALRDTPGVPVWQRNYYEHVVRSEDDLSRIREYIVQNPSNWHADPENPAAVGAAPEPLLR